MKTLIICLLSLLISASALAETKLAVSTKVSLNGEKADIYKVAIASDETQQISSAGRYDLSITATETPEKKVLLNIVFQANGETQTPTLLAEYDNEVGFEIEDTSIFFTVNKS